MMINKRLIGTLKESKKYIARDLHFFCETDREILHDVDMVFPKKSFTYVSHQRYLLQGTVRDNPLMICSRSNS